MNKLIKASLLGVFFVIASASAQVKILSNFINASSIYTESLMQVNVLNQGTQEEPAIFEAWIATPSHEDVLRIRTNMFNLKPGMNVLSNNHLSIAESAYGSGTAGKFLSINH